MYQCRLYRKNLEYIIHSEKEQHCPFCMKNFYVILQLILLIKATFTSIYHTHKDFREL